MTAHQPALQAEAQDALAALDRLLQEDAQELSADVAGAVRRLVKLRDDLIERRRRDGLPPPLGNALGQINAILSSVVGAEFPIKGLHRKRIETARDALRGLLDEHLLSA